ncbi:MAG: acetyl-CoA C-acyltransferase [Deltaproteobacteria bacterium]|nr:acetyl-CoA C-acyltransferase [Deltaproteobacteria bacterium]
MPGTASVIVSAARTPIGGFLGALQHLSAPELGAVALQAAVARARITAATVQQVLMGCVLQAGVGQSPARQASIRAGIPESVGVCTVNKVCSSGLVAVMWADQMIRAGDAAVVAAGGMESMSRAPYLLPNGRTGLRLGHGLMVDAMIHDGLWDAFRRFHMGNAAELLARELQMSRAQQDAYALESYRRAQAAIAAGWFAEEIVPVPIAAPKDASTAVAIDEGPGKLDRARFANLKPVFEKDGTVTAGNASSIGDGAAALVVMSEAAATQYRCAPLARIVAHAGVAQAPEKFTTAPERAVAAACEKAGLRPKEIDLFEINEAFACVAVRAIDALQLDPKQVNVHGGAVALGHPIGASGARLLVTLLHAMKRLGARRGCVSLCNGGGEATAMIVER